MRGRPGILGVFLGPCRVEELIRLWLGWPTAIECREMGLHKVLKWPGNSELVGCVAWGSEIQVQGEGAMGGAKVPHGNREVADELYPVGGAEYVIPPGGLVRMMGQASIC